MSRKNLEALFQGLQRGLITEASAFTFPEEASVDEDNCFISFKGNRRRRLGVEFEESAVKNELPVTDSETKQVFSWSGVNENSSKTFQIVRLGGFLYFFDNLETLSSGLMTDTIDLSDFKFADSFNNFDPDLYKTSLIDVVSFKGVCFVVGEAIKPFYITYSETTEQFVTSTISLQIRDFEGLEDGLEVNDFPTSLSKEHEYNLRNQGWRKVGANEDYDPIAVYNAGVSPPGSRYPANSSQWILAKGSDGTLSVNLVNRFASGTTHAPRGSCLLDPFKSDRTASSGVSGITIIERPYRPVAVTSFSGRLWYGSKTSVYYSQVLEEGFRFAGKCYQEGDPTAEETNKLVATDGGVVDINEAGEILSIRPAGQGILVFATRGVWAVQGGEDGFKADSFSTYKVSSLGLVSSGSIVDIGGVLLYWSDQGICLVQRDNVSFKYNVTNISQGTIQRFYDEIHEDSKKACVGVYDRGLKRVQWLYKEDPSDLYDTKILNFDAGLQAFYPWTISKVDSTGLLGAVDVDRLISAGEYPSAEETFQELKTSLKYFTFTRKSDILCEISFAEFSNRNFKDWESIEGGSEFVSFVETGNNLLGDLPRPKAVSSIIAFFGRTETGYELVEGSYVFENPSSCLLQVKWDFEVDASTGKWSKAMEAYRPPKNLQDTPSPTDLGIHRVPAVIVTKNFIRGNGRAIRVRFNSVSGKDFNLLGWSLAGSLPNQA